MELPAGWRYTTDFLCDGRSYIPQTLHNHRPSIRTRNRCKPVITFAELLVSRRCSESTCAVVSLYRIDIQKLSPETCSLRREHCDEFLEMRNSVVCYPPGCHQASKIPCCRTSRFTDTR